MKWEPGAPRTVAEVPLNANVKTLRRAARNDVFDADSRTALPDMANDIRNGRTTSVVHGNEIFGEREYREKPNAVIIGAGPIPPLHFVDDRQAPRLAGASSP
ncbi:hypothetical protein DMH18_36720 [Streptomyces sp. WAC 06783]|uniref:hypothetical protein n=1 Tax=Streptomyces sp. WAC 06783 TaxID=2203211 RepID=UPI000F744D58|nr:hypothetical protein [Streptomyces sp. WAC 06783]RSO03703.1 hypothetical protein DMH18_36720 [Streptomyces sp. WAC 06783]